MARPVCVVVGVGPGNGAAFARKWAREGYAVALLARSTDFTDRLASELGEGRAYACDVTDLASVERAFGEVRRDFGDVDVLIYNAGSGSWANFDDTSADAFEQSWRVNAYGGLVTAKQVVPAMKERGSGNIVFIGATASRRGAVQTVAFAAAKAAQRSLAQSMARYLWPLGIHVSLVVIDAVVDHPRTRERMPDKPDDFFSKPADIADSVFSLTRQPRSAWSFEIETRPFGEKW